MTHPLDGPRLKVARAKRQIVDIRTESDRFASQCDYRIIVAELKPNRTQYALRALVNVLPPTETGILIGQVAHHLRSALDGLIYQLAKRAGASEKALAWTQFPIYLNNNPPGCVGKCARDIPAHFNCRGLRLIKPLQQVHKTVIEGLQPYQPMNGGTDNPLHLLNELNNADKHRLLQVVGGKPTGYMVSGGFDETDWSDYVITARILEDGAEVGLASVTAVRAQRVQVDQQIVPYIAFWEGCEAVKGRGVAITLDLIADHVSEIVEKFAVVLA